MESDARIYRAPPAFASPMVRQWERGLIPAWLLPIQDAWNRHSDRVRLVFRLALAGCVIGAAAALPAALRSWERLHDELTRANDLVAAREGELQLLRLDMDRLERILEKAGEHRIPVDLAAQIYDISASEGLDADLAFSLVQVESNFRPSAVSSAGAVGLTQVMPSTASWLEPGIGYRELFEGGTNLRLGFRYLRQLTTQYKGDLRLALLAYNRGPTRVDSIRSAGGDPGNGYATAVMRGARRNATQPRP